MIDAKPVALSGSGRTAPRPAGLRPLWLGMAILALAVAVVLAVAIGPVWIPPGSVAAELIDHIPGIHIDSGLSEQQSAIKIGRASCRERVCHNV